MAYEAETKEAILARMLAAVPSDLDKRQGSIIYDMQSPAAIEAAKLYIALDQVMQRGFADTAAGEDLERRVGEMGITRKPAIAATGSVTFTGINGSVIPAGTRISTDTADPIYFLTTAAGTIAGGSVTVNATAEVGGISGNVVTGAISLVSGNLSGVTGVTNAQAFTNGVDAESDEELYDRYVDRVSAPSTSGNANHYKAWAKQIPGISDAKAYPVWNGPGTVKVVLLDDLSTAPDPAKVTEVAAYIEAQKPIGATVTVLAATEVPITVTATLTLQNGYTTAQVKPVIEEGIRAYLASLAFKDTIVRYSRIVNVILDTVGVVDYSSLLVNGSTANITIADGSVAVRGTVTLS